jgi:hypothetical protein
MITKINLPAKAYMALLATRNRLRVQNTVTIYNLKEEKLTI